MSEQPSKSLVKGSDPTAGWHPDPDACKNPLPIRIRVSLNVIEWSSPHFPSQSIKSDTPQEVGVDPPCGLLRVNGVTAFVVVVEWMKISKSGSLSLSLQKQTKYDSKRGRGRDGRSLLKV